MLLEIESITIVLPTDGVPLIANGTYKTWQLLVALERNLQPGGTLLFFPSPYEDHKCEVCSVHDHTGSKIRSRGEKPLLGMLETVSYTHPAICLRTAPRSKRTPIHWPPDYLVPEKMRVIMSDILRLEEFKPAGPAQGETLEGASSQEEATSQRI
ncbi:unnamed protein product [Haemonchus placei]|uniref:Transposase n=1 Tax=Haemonchus placei TaxID=6290 RepID=A0A0N4W8E7_HAEPC|nr:unnamed protein product [Haemonchus placei]